VYERHFVERTCADCGSGHLDYPDVEPSRCFDCSQILNVFALKNIRCSIDAAGEDSSNPQRIANGTAGINMALPGVVTKWGKRNAYGQRTVLEKRPVYNNEITSTRALKERAKRAGMTLAETPKRALGK
jgi:hypothetical protein